MSDSRGVKVEAEESLFLPLEGEGGGDEPVRVSPPVSGEKRKREEPTGDEEEGGRTKKVPKYAFGPLKKASKKPTGVSKSEKLTNRLNGTGHNPETMSNPTSRTTLPTPVWYSLVPKTFRGSRGLLVALDRVKTLHLQAKKAVLDGQSPVTSLAEIRINIHKFLLEEHIDRALVKKCNLLTNRILHSIFDSGYFDGVTYPTDIQEDAFILYQQWFEGNVDGNLLRGIKSVKRTKDTRVFRSHSHDLGYEFRKDPNFHGDHCGTYQLRNGMWWPLQICASRDGVHGEIEAGIRGKKGDGAYSVVMSGKGYANIDSGDRVQYCGTASEAGATNPSNGTALLLESHQNGRDIRLLRSANATKPYAPAIGLRFDGLYRIVDTELLDANRHMYRFTMDRQPGQSPIRYQGPGVRPSAQEQKKFLEIQNLLSGRANQ